ncbi:hypothetical protein B296_00048663 [Ensete ventricosum]|uniref:GIY-YIG domain-containing protein n=1 Tax=Ensete ventricosum TaxID=4639 RepID=A0A426YTQ8_ENSVE|nr:hypothetical protein B296_00048663 [Ensete ventricosum]
MRLSTTLRSVKGSRSIHTKSTPASSAALSPSSLSLPSSSLLRNHHNKKRGGKQRRPKNVGWSVYLIVSSRLPRTYVGVTTNFLRRLKQHNGILKGGAKACSAGRPWTLACIIRGFKDRSEACEFESKWKSVSRRMPRKTKQDCAANPLLEHRRAALNCVGGLFDCSYLQIEWQSSLS